MTKQVLQQALEALIWECGSEPALYAPKTAEAIEALREALAQQGEQQPNDALIRAWQAGFYHAGYTNDQAYADKMAREYAGAAPAAQPDGWEKECKDTDKLLAHLGLDPDLCRTDGGWLNLPRIKELLAQQGEPVAWMVTTEKQDGTRETYPMTGRYKDVKDVCDFGEPIPLYAAAAPAAQPDTWTDDGGWTFPIEKPTKE